MQIVNSPALWSMLIVLFVGASALAARRPAR